MDLSQCNSRICLPLQIGLHFHQLHNTLQWLLCFCIIRQYRHLLFQEWLRTNSNCLFWFLHRICWIACISCDSTSNGHCEWCDRFHPSYRIDKNHWYRLQRLRLLSINQKGQSQISIDIHPTYTLKYLNVNNIY